MPYEFYKLLHFICLFSMISSLTIMSVSDQSKKANITYGIASSILFIAGVGLLHKSGISITTPWVLGKISIWAILSILAPIVAKRFSSFKKYAFYIFFFLIIVASYLAIFK